MMRKIALLVMLLSCLATARVLAQSEDDGSGGGDSLDSCFRYYISPPFVETRYNLLTGKMDEVSCQTESWQCVENAYDSVNLFTWYESDYCCAYNYTDCGYTWVSVSIGF